MVTLKNKLCCTLTSKGKEVLRAERHCWGLGELKGTLDHRNWDTVLMGLDWNWDKVLQSRLDWNRDMGLNLGHKQRTNNSHNFIVLIRIYQKASVQRTQISQTKDKPNYPQRAS